MIQSGLPKLSPSPTHTHTYTHVINSLLLLLPIQGLQSFLISLHPKNLYINFSSLNQQYSSQELRVNKHKTKTVGYLNGTSSLMTMYKTNNNINYIMKLNLICMAGENVKSLNKEGKKGAVSSTYINQGVIRRTIIISKCKNQNSVRTVSLSLPFM